MNEINETKSLLTIDHDSHGEPVETDYTLEEGNNHVWITVRGLSVMLKQADDGLTIEVGEGDDLIDGLLVYWPDAT